MTILITNLHVFLFLLPMRSWSFFIYAYEWGCIELIAVDEWATPQRVTIKLSWPKQQLQGWKVTKEIQQSEKHLYLKNYWTLGKKKMRNLSFWHRAEHISPLPNWANWKFCQARPAMGTSSFSVMDKWAHYFLRKLPLNVTYEEQPVVCLTSPIYILVWCSILLPVSLYKNRRSFTRE